MSGRYEIVSGMVVELSKDPLARIIHVLKDAEDMNYGIRNNGNRKNGKRLKLKIARF